MRTYIDRTTFFNVYCRIVSSLGHFKCLAKELGFYSPGHFKISQISMVTLLGGELRGKIPVIELVRNSGIRYSSQFRVEAEVMEGGDRFAEQIKEMTKYEK